MHERYLKLAELWQKTLDKTITASETQEFKVCLNWNLRLCQRHAELINESQLAHNTDDVDWQEQIAYKMSRLKEELQ